MPTLVLSGGESELIDKLAPNVPTRHTSSRLDTNMSAFTLSSTFNVARTAGLSKSRAAKVRRGAQRHGVVSPSPAIAPIGRFAPKR